MPRKAHNATHRLNEASNRREQMTHPISRQAVAQRLALWDKTAAIHFCRLAQAGATFENVVYPTGLRMVKATLGKHVAEVKLSAAKQLRADGYRIRCAA
jgi:hypothetical protein